MLTKSIFLGDGYKIKTIEKDFNGKRKDFGSLYSEIEEIKDGEVLMKIQNRKVAHMKAVHKEKVSNDD